MNPTLDQEMPYSREVEVSILGAILLDNHAYDQAAARVKVEDFHLDSHRRLWLAIVAIMEEGRPVDFNSLTEQLIQMKELESIGGVAYLIGLTDGLPRVKNIGEYIRILENHSTLRKLIHACSCTIRAAYERQDTARRIVGYHDDQVMQIIARSDDTCAQTPAQFSEDLLTEIHRDRARGEVLPGFSYGVADLDYKTTGIRPKEFTIIGGRPKDGKTALALQAIQANCSQKIPVAFFSVEMNKEAIHERLLSSVSKVPFRHLRERWRLTDEEMIRIHNAKEAIDEWPLYIDDSAEITVTEICARARLLQRRHGVKLVVVDYMQIINGHGDIRQRLIKISRALRTLAKTHGLAVIGLSQLARPSDKNINKPPANWDLKESGSLEADANTILLIFRPEYVGGEDGNHDSSKNGIKTGEDEIRITQRSGEASIAVVTYVGRWMRFEDRSLRGI